MKYAAVIIWLLSCPAFAVVGDFTADNCVDYDDLAIFADHWLEDYAATDLNSDDITDFADFAMMAQNWWNCGDAACTTTPDKATTPDPANHATAVSLTKTLSWSVADCNGETNRNDVYFGEYGSITKVVSNSFDHTYSPALEPTHRYQWRIDTINNKGTTTGDLWDFYAVVSQPPVAVDAAASATTYIVCPIILSATDDGYPSPPAKLKYVITALPSDTTAYVQDPVSGGQLRIAASNLPYKLSSWGNTIWFATTTAGVTTFKFKAYDGEQYSNEATVTITTAANPQDCLSFDGSGYVTIPDTGDYFDLVHGRGIALFIKTRIPYAKILSKYAPGAAGYEYYIIGGVPTVKLYDADGLTATVSTGKRLNDGTWHNVGFIYDGSGLLNVYDANEAIFSGQMWGDGQIESGWTAVPARTYSNSLSVIVGSGFKWELDNIRAYSMDLENNYFCYSSFTGQPRATAGDLDSWSGFTLYPAAAVRFHCNYDGTNNTTTQIYDDISATHLVGTFNSASHVRYLPWVWQWYDSAANLLNIRRER